MQMRFISSIVFLFLIAGYAHAQEDSYVKLGQKALVDGDFKVAVINLERALATDSNNVNTLYMLGYSYYHSANYKKGVATFTRLVSLKPNESSAYYYRGKARCFMATETAGLQNAERERLLLAAVRDFSKAITINSEDIKLYQNRAIAYRDYGTIKAQKIPKIYDKVKAIDAFKACIIDFQRVLDLNPGRKDISNQLENAKQYLENIK
jgi:tetratricopeptide (TPR) repeat protein